MKKRIITGVGAALFAIALLVFMQYPLVLSLPMAFFGAIACHELLGVSGCKNKALTYVSMAFTAIMPIYVDLNLAKYIPVPAGVMVIAYILVLFCIMLKNYSTTKFEHLGLALVGSILVPASLCAILYVRDLYKVYPEFFQQAQCVFICLCAFFSAWMSDTWAYFVGRKLGKHRLAPQISPKKSVEGFVAGCLGNALFCTGAFIFCDKLYFHMDTVKLWMVIPAAIALSAMGTLGDLSASVIKRNYGAKDYGTFFPGHGGVMDRIDSLLFVMPTLYVILRAVLAFVK